MPAGQQSSSKPTDNRSNRSKKEEVRLPSLELLDEINAIRMQNNEPPLNRRQLRRLLHPYEDSPQRL
jgi:hypothetical protein